MNDMTPTREQREAKLEGMCCKRKRVEDIRFTQGKGNFVDDLKLPGMLHGDFVRSPHAHARVTAIRKDEALKVPGVLAVLTALPAEWPKAVLKEPVVFVPSAVVPVAVLELPEMLR